MSAPTECDELLRLTDRQATAIDLLLAGKSDTATSEAIGAHRTTISRWRAYHPAFQAELTRRRAELFGSATERLRAMVPKALEVLEAELDGENKLNTAQSILRMAGLDKLDPPKGSPDDAEDILLSRLQRRLGELKREREESMTIDQRLLAMSTEPSLETKLEIAVQALADVRAELRQKIAGDAITCPS